MATLHNASSLTKNTHKSQSDEKGAQWEIIVILYLSDLYDHHKEKSVIGYLESLKYRITMIAITRTKTMPPIIHLFLLILLDMLVKIFLLFPMLSSTPWSCMME